MSRRLRLPLQPWLARAQSTTTRAPLPSPMQRELFRRVAQPVAVITAHIPSPASPSSTAGTSTASDEPQHNHGATLSSLASISLSPPLVSFSLRLPSRLAAFLSTPTAPAAAGAHPAEPTFRVHLLSTRQEPLARAFARQAPLPAKAQPSPPPSSSPSVPSSLGAPPAPPQASTLAHFDPALFAELERTGLGSLDCRVVQRVPLSPLGASQAGAGVEEQGTIDVDDEQPRSELFIARVEGVRLGEAEMDEDETALLYWDQQYAGARALEADEAEVGGQK
ncbi:hypothetical protein JCM8208_001343 [Rhodotorula glutinis]